MGAVTDEQYNNILERLQGEDSPFAPVLQWAQDINVGFVLTSGYLVFMMQAGFLLLTAGSVRSKSVRSVCVKNLMDACFGGFGYWVVGWAFAYGDKTNANGDNVGNPFIGTTWFVMSGTPPELYYSWFFQWTFAISTATIVAGAVAERLRFEAYALYALFLTMWVYPVATHWIWSGAGWASPTRAASVGGLLLGQGAYDTVGSGAVHMLSGVAGLWGAVVLGPRIGRFNATGQPVDLVGHNSVFFILGVFLLWFGFYGFNPGTMYMIVGFSNVVARCAVSTTLGAVFGGITGLIMGLVWYLFKERKIVWCLHSAAGSALAGMVVITSGCGVYQPWAAALGGILGGVVYLPSCKFMLHVCKVDDPCEVFSLHGVCGALGVLWQALMAEQDFVHQLYGRENSAGNIRKWGWWRGSDATILGANAIWIVTIFGWTTGMMLPFFLLLKVLGILRVPVEEETMGVDVSKHGGMAYDLSDMPELTKVSSGNGIDQESKIALLESRLSAMSEKLAMLEKKQVSVV